MASSNELAQRVDGVARVLMTLIADLEQREQLDGARLCRDLRQLADTRRTMAGLEVSAHVIEQIAEELDGARATRRSRGRRV